MRKIYSIHFLHFETVKPRTWSWMAAAIVTAHFLTWAWFAGRFLPLNPDEIGIAAYSYNWVTGHGLRYGLNDDIFAPEAYQWRECSFEVMRPIADFWVGIFLLLQRSPFFARLSMGAASAVALYFFFLIGRRLHSPPLGVFCMVAALADPFWFLGSATVRAEMPLLAASTGVLLLWMSWNGPWPWKEFIIGVLAGLQVGIHPNAIPVHMGIVVAYLLLKHPVPPWDSLMRFSLGALAGAVVIFCCLNVERLALAFSWFLTSFHRPPILAWPWHPLQWVKSTIYTLGSGHSYYVSKELVPAWPLTVALYWSGVMVYAVYGCRLYRQAPDTRKTLRALGSAVIITFFGIVLFVAHQDALYALNLKTALVPLQGFIFLCACLRIDAFSRIVRVLGTGLLASSLLVFISSAIVTAPRYKGYPQLIEEIQAVWRQVPHERVIGPLYLWYGLPLNAYRDAGALVISRYYTEGRADVARWIRPWSPDIFVVDRDFRRTYMRDSTQSEQESLRRLLGRDLRLRGKIDGGVYYGPLAIYQVLPSKK